MRRKILVVVMAMSPLLLLGQSKGQQWISKESKVWADSVYQTLSLEQRIAQLFWLAIENPQKEQIQERNARLIERCQPGGLIFFRSGANELAALSNRFQKLSKVPLMMAIDGEWGLAMRITDVEPYPYQMTLGAIRNDSLIYHMGWKIGQDLKQLGVDVNLAPVADVNSNPLNPVIGKRSFGEDPLNVARKSWAYASGLQEAGVIAVGKHFPGHGDTNKDSHYTLPLVNHDRARLDTMELLPFEFLIDKGIMGLMSAHLSVPCLEARPNLPSSLSKAIVGELLRDEMGYGGLVITDAMNMKGVASYVPAGEAELMALQAGNDIVEFTTDLPKAIETVKKAVLEGALPEADLEVKCKKVLAAKYWCGRNSANPVEEPVELSTISSPDAAFLKRQLYRAAITVIKNKAGLPFKSMDDLDLTVVCFAHTEEWRNNVWRYKEIEVVNGTESLSVRNEQSKILIALRNIKEYRANKTAVDQLLGQGNAILVFQGNPYDLSEIKQFDEALGLILTYEDNMVTRDLVSQLLFGAIDATGRLPVRVNARYKAGSGVDVIALGRLEYTMPEALGMDSRFIDQKVDSVVNKGLEMNAFPGCRVLVAVQGKVIFDRCYGFHTYDSLRKVQCHDVFDLASITKIAGPLPLIMEGVDEGIIDLDRPMSKYWKDWRQGWFHRSNKSRLVFRDILAHQAGLIPYINYYPLTLQDSLYNPKYYRTTSSAQYNLQVDDHLFLKNKVKKDVYKTIRRSALLDDTGYKYSGLSFMVYPEMLTRLFQEDYSEKLDRAFYRPLGASSLGYNPIGRMDTARILPTEMDNNYRHKLMKGRVHDEAAAVMGGVSGNAGLFSSAYDLAKFMQMYLQKGQYAGKRYLSEAVVNEFSRVQFPDTDNRRGLGFDKPLLGNDTLSIEQSYPAPGVSASSFGHGGFTGTFVWMDPEYELLYIFLSNRVYPSRNNRLIYQRNIRPSIQQVFYDALKIAH